MSKDAPKLTFSQRNGLCPIPQQLKLGEVSAELRRLLDYYIQSDLDRNCFSGYSDRYFGDVWVQFTRDLHVKFFKQPITKYRNSPSNWSKAISDFLQVTQHGELFDFLETVISHPNCGGRLEAEIISAFVDSSSAYRVIDRQVIAIGNEEQANSVMRALDLTSQTGSAAIRSHLVAAGAQLTAGNWAASVRESIHAVESAAVQASPETPTLGAALSSLERKGRLHGALKSAFSALYGYANDAEGVRHALVFKDKSDVDEADALFMLGACASFVTYLTSRRTEPEDKGP